MLNKSSEARCSNMVEKAADVVQPEGKKVNSAASVPAL